MGSESGAWGGSTLPTCHVHFPATLQNLVLGLVRRGSLHMSVAGVQEPEPSPAALAGTWVESGSET